MGPRTLAFLRVVAAAAVIVLVLLLASELVAWWILFAAAGAAAVLAVWMRGRRICCYLCRGSVTEGSGVYWINSRRRLVCLRCQRVNGLIKSEDGNSPAGQVD